MADHEYHKNHEASAGKVYCVEFREIEYHRAFRIQQQLLEGRRSGIIASDVFLLLEHLPVFTLGRRGGRHNLLVPDDVLEKARISIVQTDRGGDITYHGPGQLVVYPIVDLKKVGLGIRDFVTRLEEVMIRTAALWGVKAVRNPRNRGVWVADNKLGSIGLAIHHGITTHGLAFNVNPSLTHFG